MGLTKLEYHDDMFKLQSTSTLISFSQVAAECNEIFKLGDGSEIFNPGDHHLHAILKFTEFGGEDGRYVMVLVSTIFHPQGGGQPSDTGFITLPSDPNFKFIVTDARSKDGIVFHYGSVGNSDVELDSKLKKGVQVILYVDEPRRKLHSRLHSAGHLLDACLENVGLGYLEPSKAYHFPDGPYVEYKGKVPQDELQSKQKELEIEANKLICRGCRVAVATLPYDEASKLCGGSLPDYIPKESTPRIVKLGDYPGCPCGGTHVSDVKDIGSMKVSQMRTKKGVTKVFYNVAT